jgi:hypothetical protein
MSNQKTSADLARARRRSDRSGGATTGVVDLHRQLLDIAFDLSVEFDTLPAGSVLRCFARAVHLARLQGAEGARVPEEARRIAVSSLRSRAATITSRRRHAPAALRATA